MTGQALVTGAAGFIGSRVAKSLADDGVPVVVLERDRPARSGLDVWGLRGRVDIVQGDVCDAALVRRVLTEYDVTTIYHLAAQVIVGIANRSPESTFETNIRGTWTLLEACRTTEGIEAVVVASSDKAYGPQETLPYTEDAPLGAVYPYDVSKACADLLARSYGTTYELPVVVTRCANVYGPGDANLSRLVPEVALAAAGEAPLIRSDGTPERDYLYVEDCVRAYRLLADSVAARRELRGQAFNVGTGVPVSVLELVRTALQAAGRPDIEPHILGAARHEIDRQYLDATKIRDMLGYEPRWSLAEGLRETVSWYRANLGLFAKPNGATA